jgi:hypothetical protein
MLMLPITISDDIHNHQSQGATAACSALLKSLRCDPGIGAPSGLLVHQAKPNGVRIQDHAR